MRIRALVVAALCAVGIAVLGAGSAFAGEVNGNGDQTAGISHANSICVFSGLNDNPYSTDPEDPGGRVQNYGQIVAAGGKAFVPSPGVACNGHTGELAGGPGGE